MATGFCPALLLDINDVAGQNAPGRKLHIAGFLAMLFCCQNSLANVIQTGTQGGHRRPLTVKYRPRPLASSVQDEDDCDINAIPAYQEWNVPALSHKQVSFYLSDETVRQYCIDASRVREFGRTRVMDEVYGNILDFANVLMKAINTDLVTEMATSFGENVTTGEEAGTFINFNTSGDAINLSNGLIQILRDIEENEICGTPCLVGGGLWSAEWLAQQIACCNAAGLNTSGLNSMLPRLFNDKDTQTVWGTNSAGLFAPGSVKFISWDKYVGEGFSGQKGSDFFTNFAMPVNEFGCNLDDCLRDLRIDMQLRYIPCPGEYDVNGTPTQLDRGWQVILSKDYALWVQPTTAYQSGDPLADTNGTIKYFASNTSYSGGAYSLY